jgi:putative sterol carrier protein
MGFASKTLFDMIGSAVSADASIAKKVNGVLVYKLKNSAGEIGYWTLDLKGAGAVYEGQPKGKKADVTFELKDEDFMKMAQKKANPQQLFMSGKLKLKGNMGLAMKFEKVLNAVAPNAKL